MDGNGLKETKSDRNRVETSASIPRRPFKWFVLVTYAIFSSSLAMSEIIFAPIPKQTAAYYGIKGQYFLKWMYFLKLYGRNFHMHVNSSYTLDSKIS